jgi:colanic acid/amylovoran biosynthesis protein
LGGNGPYINRGCEAIVRGTMAILRHEFGDNIRVTVGTFERPDIVSDQAAHETDMQIAHVALRSARPVSRWSPAWFWKQITRRLGCQRGDYGMLDEICGEATCALEIGGDNYTLDYGRPYLFIRLDEYLHRHGVPVVLWGASVGPFESDVRFAPGMFTHLRSLEGIIVRESESHQYLEQHGVKDNLHRMSDPAFMMEPGEPAVKPAGCRVLAQAIGLNLSPLMARYVTGGDLNAWTKLAAGIVRSIIRETHRDVLLIPHVTWQHTDDRAFLGSVANACAESRPESVSCLDGNYSAAEIKWVISRCAAFVGARTHSTIAAISSSVPTLSLAYSRKARGLNQDIFGSQEYCLQPAEISPEAVSCRLAALLANRDAIVDRLGKLLPGIRAQALQGGTILRRIIEHR